jgi:hypothetical protein
MDALNTGPTGTAMIDTLNAKHHKPVQDKEQEKKDIVIFTYQSMIIVSPGNGGTLYDWIYFDTGNPQSVINTINLIKEPYHDAAAAMVEWFKEKIWIYKKLIEEMSPWLSEWEKENLLRVRVHEQSHLHEKDETNIETIDYPAFQDKISSLAPLIKEITEKEPSHIKIISLYSELCKRPVFEGTKTLTKPIQNLKVVKALQNYDTRLPVNQIARIRDTRTGKEAGRFSHALFDVLSARETPDTYTIVLQKKDEQIIMKKIYHISKHEPSITMEYQIKAEDGRLLELEIENNTNISFIDNTDRYFQVNNQIIPIYGKTVYTHIHSMAIINNHENCIQEISVTEHENRLIIEPRYSVSQGLRMFETTLQYVRYTIIIPITGGGKKPSAVTLSHSLSSHLKAEEENTWIMNQ